MDKELIEKITREVISRIERSNSKREGSPSGRTEGPSGCPSASEEVKVTFGTAGKVFDVHREPDRKLSPQCPAFLSPGSECQECGECLTQKPAASRAVISAGADRIGVRPRGEVEKSLSALIDHTLLKADATQEQIGRLCSEARRHGFASVCVNPAHVALASQLLKGTDVKVCTVVGFPLGATTPTVKAIEARDAIANGAEEIDMVINVGALKAGNLQLVFDDIKAVRTATKGKVLKVIIETALLTDEEKVKACQLAKEAAADFVKTSTGFGPSGATVEDIRLMRQTIGPEMGIKASGGIRTQEQARAMVKAGATRIGASASVAIVTKK